MSIIQTYFPGLTDKQYALFEQAKTQYAYWNERINVISRKDMENFTERHILHSLAIAKVIAFEPGTAIMDVGTGGGFPGIPLAIMFPGVQFTLVDSIGKKITVVNNVAAELGLTNVTGIHERAEKIKGQFDFIVSRAVTDMPAFLTWVKGKFKRESRHALTNGVLYLKGGDLKAEMMSVVQFYREYPIAKFYAEPFFETKKVVYVKAG